MTLQPNDVYNIDNILKYGIYHNASDINITTDEELAFRINGDIKKINHKPNMQLINNYIDVLTKSMSKKIDVYQKTAIDGSYVMKFKNEDYYFRYNISLTIQKVHMTIRKLINKIPKFEDIQLTNNKELEFIKKINDNKTGLYLLVGATGSGKTTTIVTILDYVLKNNKIKAISLEEPIEFYFKNKDYENSIIIQREVHKDTKSFYDGLVEAMRQNPDLIFVGEIRDKNTAIAALNAALTGHVVIATLHAKSIEKTTDRFKYLLDGITNDLDFIQGIIYQQLNKDENGKIKAIRDVYINKENF